MNIYLDESGDLGWTLDRPYRKGGSSRYLTIAKLIIPKTKKQYPKRIVRKLYNKKNWNPTNELKATHLNNNDREYISKKAINLLNTHIDMKLCAITVNKKNVQNHIRKDSNKLYNYMIRLSLLDYIKDYSHVTFIPDNRTIKVKSQNSLHEYLQTYLWFEMNSNTILNNCPEESSRALNLQFIDYIANIIWRKYEFKDDKAFNLLRYNIYFKELFF